MTVVMIHNEYNYVIVQGWIPTPAAPPSSPPIKFWSSLLLTRTKHQQHTKQHTQHQHHQQHQLPLTSKKSNQLIRLILRSTTSQNDINNNGNSNNSNKNHIERNTEKENFQQVKLQQQQEQKQETKNSISQPRGRRMQQQHSNSNSNSNKPPSFAQAVYATTSKARIGPSSNDTNISTTKRTTSTTASTPPRSPSRTVNIRNTPITSNTSPKKQRSVNTMNSDSSIGTFHSERIKLAGRVGTKRYIDPCKVYIGNLPYMYTNEMLSNWICTIVLGLPSQTVINQCSIVYDWKTGRSKGYGFVVLTEPIYATVLIDKCNTNATIGTIDSRRLTVSQGISKDKEQQLFIEEQQWLERERKRMNSSISSDGEFVPIEMDEDEIRMLKSLDPDLVQGVTVRQPISKDKLDPSSTSSSSSSFPALETLEQPGTSTNDDNDEDQEEDYIEDGDGDGDFDFEVEVDVEAVDNVINNNEEDDEDNEDDDDDGDDEDYYDWESVDGGVVYDDSDDGVDGVWYEDDVIDDILEFVDDDDGNDATGNNTSGMNREQRRNATAAAKKRKKLPNKGFG